MKLNEFLAASKPYELIINISYHNGASDTKGVKITGSDLDGDYSITPVVRPLSDLTKPITQKNYNNGEPFVPIVELAKMFAKCKEYPITGYGELTLDVREYKVKCFVENSQYRYLYYSIPKDLTLAEYRVVQLLLEWHFDLLDEGIEKVLVTDEFNPY